MWGKKWLVDFNAGKTQLALFYRSDAIVVKMDGSALEEKSTFKMMGLTFSSKSDWGPYIISVAETASKKIEALNLSISFFLLRLLCISINPRYGYAWKIVVTSGMVSLVATWNC